MTSDSSNPEARLAPDSRVVLARRLRFFLGWLYWFYPEARGVEPAYMLYTFFPQKVLRINGRVPWPVHFTSRVLNARNITVGNGSAPGLSHGCYLQGRGGIRIGDNVRMGPNVGVVSANHHPEDFDRWVADKPVTIGDNVWIGMNAVVLPGVSIGDNVIVGAGSVVTRDIPADCLAAGNPCRVIRQRTETGSSES